MVKVTYKTIISSFVAIIFCLSNLYSLNDRYTITVLDNPSPGYLNITGGHGVWGSLALIDNYGIPRYDAQTIHPLEIQKFMPNGYWLVNTNVKNKLHIYDKTPILVDSIVLPSNLRIDTHDFLLLNNGHYLLALIHDTIMDLSDLIDGGFENSNILGLKLVEVDKTGNIYWSWNCFNYFSILDVTNDIDLAQPAIDFTHCNSMAEDANGDIIISLRNFDEIIKISKQTGNIVWRLGGSASKNNQFNFVNDNNAGFKGFSHQHSVVLTSEGNILTYDNGSLRSPQFSRAVEYRLNTVNMTATKVWEYRRSPDIYMGSQGSVQRLSNGNTLINWGIDYINEVKPDGTIALELSLPGEFTYRAMKINIKMNDITKRVSGTGEYSFSDQYKDTRVKLNLASVNGGGKLHITKYDYAPHTLTFAKHDFTNVVPYRWIINKDSINSFSGTIKIRIDGLSGISNPNKVSICKREQETIGAFQQLVTTYNSTTNELSANFSDVGELVLISHILFPPELATPVNNFYSANLNDTLKWRKLYGASSYNIQISKESNFSEKIVNSIINSDTLFNYQNLEYDSRYYWRVRGLNTKDTSQWSDTRTFSTLLSSPALLSPVNNYFGFKLTDTLKWQSVGTGIKYRIQISTDANYDSLLKDENDISTTKYITLLNKYNTTYFWRVKAYRDVDSSNWSSGYRFTTLMNTPLLSFPVNNSINLQKNLLVSWKEVSGATSYKLQVSKDNEFIDNLENFYNITANNFELINLDYDSKYFWRIKALRSTDSTIFSLPNNFSTVMSPINLLYPQNDTANVEDGAYLIWQESSNADNYHIQISTDTNFSEIIYEYNEIEINKFEIKSLAPYTRFFWRVRYLKADKLSEWSEIRTFTMGKGHPLIAPELSSPSNFSMNNLPKAVLIWLSVKNANSYIVQISLDLKFKNLVIDTLVNSITSYEYVNLKNSQRYYWRVKAVNQFDSSEWSRKWEFTIIAKGTLPTVQLQYPIFDDLQVPVNPNFRWIEYSNAKDYQFQLSDTDDFQDILYDIKNIKLANHQITDLQHYHEYYWRVRYSTSTFDTSEWSSVWEFSTVSEFELKAPKINSADIIDYKISINPILNWSNVTEATSYIFSLSKNSSFFPRIMKVSWHEDTTISVNNLEYNTPYYWRVAGQNDNTVSPWSAIKQFVTELKPVEFVIPENGNDKMEQRGFLSWEIIDGAVNYHIIVSDDINFDNIIIENTVIDTSVQYNLEEEKRYYWKIKARNSENESQWSQVFSFTIPKSTMVDDGKDNGIRIYPNPVKDILQINFGSNIIKNISIINNLGEQFYFTDFSDKELLKNPCIIKLSHLSSGIYYIRINTNNDVYIRKIIIIK